MNDKDFNIRLSDYTDFLKQYREVEARLFPDELPQEETLLRYDYFEWKHDADIHDYWNWEEVVRANRCHNVSAPYHTWKPETLEKYKGLCEAAIKAWIEKGIEFQVFQLSRERVGGLTLELVIDPLTFEYEGVEYDVYPYDLFREYKVIGDHVELGTAEHFLELQHDFDYFHVSRHNPTQFEIATGDEIWQFCQDQVTEELKEGWKQLWSKYVYDVEAYKLTGDDKEYLLQQR